MSQSTIGVIGLGTMGANLARNLASKGYQTSVYNRTYQKTKDLLEIWEKDKQESPSYSGQIVGFEELTKFIDSLEKPRKIMILVKSGTPVDAFLEKIYPHLDDGDIIIDTGNSNWNDTLRRQEMLETGKMFTLENYLNEDDLKDLKKVNFVGCGVSGGEEGALKGPSLMPGGKKEAVEAIIPVLKDISADDFSGGKCVTNVGLSGAGHFVKMVHNGIEYAIMQGIAEIYDLMRFYSLTNKDIEETFQRLNSGQLESFLLEITVKIFQTKAKDSDQFLVDLVKDEAKAKGTGAWTVESAMNLGVAVPSIAASVIARTISARNQSFKFNFRSIDNIKQYSTDLYKKNITIDKLRIVLEEIYRTAYLQGLDLINQANKEYNWEINLAEVVRIWQGGCIIRSRMLENLYSYFDNQEINFGKYMEDETNRQAWTSVIRLKTGVPTPVIDSVWNYLLALSNSKLPTNLIQAQRDFFGAHTYHRIDKEGDFSGGWN